MVIWVNHIWWFKYFILPLRKTTKHMTRTGYKVTEFPFDYEGKNYVGYVIHRISKGLFGGVITKRATHFTCREDLDKFMSGTFILDSENYLVPLQ